MPESPDFDQIARTIIGAPEDNIRPRAIHDVHILIIEQLRLVWNARGAADITKLEAELPGAVTKRLDAALRSLDR
jgi:hypothetical protein